jgi:translation initiation factor IF-1
MKEFDAVTMSGTVIGTNRGSATVELDNSSVVRGVIAGRLMKNCIRVVTGDRVEIEMTPYDLTKGRIIYALNKIRVCRGLSSRAVIFGLRPRQNIKQKQQAKHREEYEANVC